MKNNFLKGALPIAAIVIGALTTVLSTPKSPHKKLSFACEDCHGTASFTDVRFDHDRTGYPLEERHEDVDCKGCHTIADFKFGGEGCVHCHVDVHEAKLGSDCVNCHSARNWTDMDFDQIHVAANMPFAGSHAQMDCRSCHPGLPREAPLFEVSRCVDCHQQLYLNVSSPNHVSSGFSTDCLDCHDMHRWRPAQMGDHDAIFPIFSGAHRGIWGDCVTCHNDPGNNSNFSCFNCHGHSQVETDAAHTGVVGYNYSSAACYECHPDGKAGMFVDHDAQFFPIYSGAHLNQWGVCSDCHDNPQNAALFNCTNCHTNPITDDFHMGMPGYSYDSPSCLQCHPDGRAGLFLVHDAQYFPIYSGSHLNQWTACVSCHDSPGNQAAFNCLACHTNPTTDGFHQGIPGYAYNSPTCLQCHPDGKAGLFVDHDTQFFPIFNGFHRGKWQNCIDCHVVPDQRSVFTCVEGCHKHAQTKMNDVHQGKKDFVPNSGTICITCHPDGRK